MENLTLQQLITQTKEALTQAGASNYYKKVFKTLTNQLLLYAEEHNTDVFSMDFGLQFLEDHYSMTSKIQQKKWCATYSRCINALAEYQRSGGVTLYFVMDERTYTFPEGFRNSAEEYISHREKIGIIKKSNKVCSLDTLCEASHKVGILADYVSEISVEVKAIAQGDLTKNGEDITDFLGDFSELKASLLYILKRFNSTLTEISNLAGQVSSNASEVEEASKSLADSAKSAVNTRDLIDKTLVEIEKGNTITRTTADAFNQIITDMESFAEIAENTMEKANSQAESLGQIGQGIEQLSGVVQGNAASSEENTAISVNLAEGAAKMNDRVNIFKLF